MGVSLPFLDGHLQRKEDGWLTVTVYKPMHMDWYLDNKAHHPIHVRGGEARSLYGRVRNEVMEKRPMEVKRSFE